MRNGCRAEDNAQLHLYVSNNTQCGSISCETRSRSLDPMSRVLPSVFRMPEETYKARLSPHYQLTSLSTPLVQLLAIPLFTYSQPFSFS
jgi:hypothetical protein